MQDRVADVLAQRAALDRGAGVGVAISVLLHAALAGFAVYTALHAPPPRAVTMVNIQFARMPAPVTAPVKKATPTAPKIVEPKPVIAEPKPEPPATPPPKPEKNTVPLSPFGQSTKKGSEKPPAPTPAPAPPPSTSTAPEVAIGGSGITGLEGGDFPHTLYLSAMHKKIGNYWYRPPSITPGTTTVIYFRIARDGTISEVKVVTPSGNTTFDRSALSAVRSASPLNPLPYAYSGTYLGVHLTFR